MGGDEKSVLTWYNEGREARLADAPREQNPYPQGEQSHACWAKGWAEADGGDDRQKGYD